jgi:cytochrome b subunit of formate dehydrogenase
LNQGTALDDSIVKRLESARELATSRQHATTPCFKHVVTGNALSLGAQGRAAFLWSRLLIPVVLLITGIFVIQSWRQVQLAEEIEEIDTAVLTGDLPIDAYTDTGFDVWLKRPLP